MKVFSREKYLRFMDEISPNRAEIRREMEWPHECNGKTMKECYKIGYSIDDSWTVEWEEFMANHMM